MSLEAERDDAQLDPREEAPEAACPFPGLEPGTEGSREDPALQPARYPPLDEGLDEG